MNKKVNVLVFPCGAENALEIYNALRFSIHVNIIGASSVNDYGRLKYDNYIGGLPNISDSSFDEAFANLIEKNEIDIVFATHDTVMTYLAEKQFDTFLVNGDLKSTKVARSKLLTYETFQDKTWVPKVYSLTENITDWPVLCKPDLGQGAQGIYKCSNKEELLENISKIDLPVVVEYLPGEELTIDCFTDRHKNLIWAQPRSRERIKAGISMKSSYVDLDHEVEKISSDINEKLNLRGPWFFQVKKDKNGSWKLLEISCRMAGTMVAQRAKGINLPLMTVQDFMERDLTLLPYSFVNSIERSIVTKPTIDLSFTKVYIDFDETIIIDNKVVPITIAFMHEMINQNKELILITRHEYNLDKTLDDNALHKKLFSQIIHIEDKSPKSNYIECKDSIFIDNHFLERLEVHEKHGIPVFDVDYLEFFIR